MTIGASSNAMRKSIGYIDDWAVYKTCLYTRDFDVSGRSDKKENDDEHEKISAADEIRKFKGLLDDGIITQEEFNAVKKKLLGL
ncbi:MAG: SHOCT domain-containing protein [Synergistaceae bacterium]|nr:SHOCT domain-containing protein [Synergistaceae bacterium]